MVKAAAFFLGLAACGGNEWPATQCAVPLEIGFGGMLDLERPIVPVAVGGTEQLGPRCASTGNEVLALDFPYAVTTTGAAVIATTDAPFIELVGVAAGSGQLAVRHGDQVYGDFDVSAEVVDAIVIGTSEPRRAPDHPWLWAPGTHCFSLTISHEGSEIADATATATAAGVTAAPCGFQLAGAQPGDYTLAAHAGTFDTTLAFSISGTADTITAPGAPAQLDHLNSSTICFAALARDHEILGLPWTFTAIGRTTTSDDSCFTVTAPYTKVGGTIDVTGAAGGQSLTLTLPVI